MSVPPREDWGTRDRRQVVVDAGPAHLAANLVAPEGAAGFVLVTGDAAHDAELGRLARDLQEAGFGTLLLHERASDRPAAVDATPETLLGALGWLAGQPAADGHRLGILAAGGHAGAAFEAAAGAGGAMHALVCLDGAFDPAALPLGRVTVPAMLLVTDQELERPAEMAAAALSGETALRVVRSPRRSLEDVLEAVLGAAISWFERHLRD